MWPSNAPSSFHPTSSLLIFAASERFAETETEAQPAHAAFSQNGESRYFAVAADVAAEEEED